MRLVAIAAIATTCLVGNAFAQSNLEPGTVFRDCDECPEMVVVPAGTFMMGSPPDEGGRDSNEGPWHEVTIARSFAIGRTEVSVAEFRAFVDDIGYGVGPCLGFGTRPIISWSLAVLNQTGRHPVVCVDVEDAEAYLDWLSEKTGATYRLPSEAEWEYAARAGTQTRYSFGDELDTLRMNVIGYRGDPRWQSTIPVGTFEPNDFGLFDVHGNTWEYTQDCRNHNYRGAPVDGSAWREGNCRYRAIRGGSVADHWRDARSAARKFVSARREQSSDLDIGFRVVRDLD